MYETNETFKQLVLLLPAWTLIGLLISFCSELLFWFFRRKKQGHGFYPSWTLHALIQWTAYTLYLVLLGMGVLAIDVSSIPLDLLAFLVVSAVLVEVMNRLAKQKRKTRAVEWFVKTFVRGVQSTFWCMPTVCYFFVVIAAIYSYHFVYSL